MTGSPNSARPAPHRSPRLRVVAAVITRLILAVFAGYGFTAIASAALALGLRTAGMVRADAVVLSAMLGFVVYLGVLLWAYVEPRLTRIALVLGVGSGIGYVLIRWWSVSSTNAGV